VLALHVAPAHRSLAVRDPIWRKMAARRSRRNATAWSYQAVAMLLGLSGLVSVTAGDGDGGVCLGHFRAGTAACIHGASSPPHHTYCTQPSPAAPAQNRTTKITTAPACRPATCTSCRLGGTASSHPRMGCLRPRLYLPSSSRVCCSKLNNRLVALSSPSSPRAVSCRRRLCAWYAVWGVQLRAVAGDRAMCLGQINIHAAVGAVVTAGGLRDV